MYCTQFNFIAYLPLFTTPAHCTNSLANCTTLLAWLNSDDHGMTTEPCCSYFIEAQACAYVNSRLAPTAFGTVCKTRSIAPASE